MRDGPLTRAERTQERYGLPFFHLVIRLGRERGEYVYHFLSRSMCKQRSAKKLMQNSADGGYDRRQRHPRVGGDDHVIPLA